MQPKAANIGTMAKYDVLNSEALTQVKAVAEIREFPEDVLTAFKTDFETVLDDVAASRWRLRRHPRPVARVPRRGAGVAFSGRGLNVASGASLGTALLLGV